MPPRRADAGRRRGARGGGVPRPLVPASWVVLGAIAAAFAVAVVRRRRERRRVA